MVTTLGTKVIFRPRLITDGVDTSWSPGVWGLNTIADQIGQVQNAPARRAAILWDHTAFSDDFAPESLEVWVSLVDWAIGIDDPAKRADAQIGFYGGYLEESVEIVKDSLGERWVYRTAISPNCSPPKRWMPTASTRSSIPVLWCPPVSQISQSRSSRSVHPTTTILPSPVSVQALTFDDAITLEVPEAYRDHPGVGGLGADGTIEWTVQGPTTLQGIGKTHNGGKAIALVQDPTTEELVPADFRH